MVHNEPMTLQDWLKSLPDSPTASQAADRAGVSKATFLRHQKKGETTAEYAIAISRAYGVNEIKSLLDLGFISLQAVKEISVQVSVGRMSNQQILDEILRRSDPEALNLFGDPTGEAIDYDGTEAPVASLDDHRSNKQSAQSDIPQDAVADDSDYHEEENTEFDD